MTLVKDWKQGWKWISSWALALIILLTTVPLPPELLELLPADIQTELLRYIAIVGFVMRYIRQPTAASLSKA